jgi:hypothetical protein
MSVDLTVPIRERIAREAIDDVIEFPTKQGSRNELLIGTMCCA